MKINRDNAGKFISKNAVLGKVTLIAIVFLLLVTVFYRAFENTVSFFRENTIIKHKMVEVELHKPIEVVSLKELERREEQAKLIEEISDKVIEEVLNPKEKTEIDLTDISWFWDIVWEHESSNGKNNTPDSLAHYCEKQGKWNEVGFNPQNDQCFNNEEHAKIRIALWIADNCEGKTRDQCLCFYNTGENLDTCSYSKGDLANAN